MPFGLERIPVHELFRATAGSLRRGRASSESAPRGGKERRRVEPQQGRRPAGRAPRKGKKREGTTTAPRWKTTREWPLLRAENGDGLSNRLLLLLTSRHLRSDGVPAITFGITTVNLTRKSKSAIKADVKAMIFSKISTFRQF